MLQWRRAARVVAWLECLAGQALDDEDDAVRRAGGSAGRFAPDEGLWKETRTRIAAGVPQKPGAACMLPLTPGWLTAACSTSHIIRQPYVTTLHAIPVLAGHNPGHLGAHTSTCYLAVFLLHTYMHLNSSAEGEPALVTELDPDAADRQRRSLAPDNVKDEERLLARLWRLVRAGPSTACDLILLIIFTSPRPSRWN